MKISGVYKITNTITNECYIGSSIDIKKRWMEHQHLSTWKKQPNKKLYIDFQKYGLDKFKFEILEEMEETTNLKEKEQYYIDLLKPSYNDRKANGFDFERRKEYNREYNKEYYKEYKSQLCNYNGEILALNTLKTRFSRKGIEYPTVEAKKYLIK